MPKGIRGPNAGQHGTYSKYRNGKCRCEPCTRAHADYCLRRRDERLAAGVPEHLHGRDNTYYNYRCRCRPCKDAHAAASRARYAARNSGGA